MKHSENKTYSLIPGDDGDQHWKIRFLEGPYSETVIQYGAISIDGKDDGIMTFNFLIESSPDEDLTVDDIDLQLWAGDVLQEIIRDAIENDYAILTDKEDESE